MKIGNTDYNVKAIKELGFEEFDKLYKNRITDTKEVYELVTSEKVEEKEKKEESIEFEVTKKPSIVKDKKMDYEKMQDVDSHWYWIPKNLVEQFEKDCRELDGKEYLEAADKFDNFTEKYSLYLTGGDKNLKPDYYK